SPRPCFRQPAPPATRYSVMTSPSTPSSTVASTKTRPQRSMSGSSHFRFAVVHPDSSSSGPIPLPTWGSFAPLIDHDDAGRSPWMGGEHRGEVIEQGLHTQQLLWTEPGQVDPLARVFREIEQRISVAG